MAAIHASLELRAHDPDRYVAALFTPAEKRPALFALYAFDTELARLRNVVSSPLPGEIRLQWWREVIEGGRCEEAAGHPIAKPLLAAIARHRLPRAAFLTYLEGRQFELYDDPFASVAELEAYCGQTHSAILRLATLILADGGDPGPADAPGHAGVALGIVAMLRDMQRASSRRPMWIPLDVLQRHGLDRDGFLSGQPKENVRAAWRSMIGLAERHLHDASYILRQVSDDVEPAFLTLVLVYPWLFRLDRAGFDPLAQPVEISRLRRLWRLWRGARQMARRQRQRG